MGNPNSNQMRAFADVVSIEAWHSEFDHDCQRADLHADVSFSTARMGGEPESSVRFRLAVKRAELVVVIPETEPIKVDPVSVARDPATAVGTKEIVTQSEHMLSANADLEASVSPTALTGTASIKASAGGKYNRQQQTRLSFEFNGFKIQHRKDREGHHAWVIESDTNRAMHGRPWDALEKPRLTLIDKRSHPTSSLPPVVRLEVRCLREDLDISDIELKDGDGWAKNFTEGQRAKKLKAAEAYIRNKLEEEGLLAVKMDENFAEIVMAHITADSV